MQNNNTRTEVKIIDMIKKDYTKSDHKPIKQGQNALKLQMPYSNASDSFVTSCDIDLYTDEEKPTDKLVEML